MSDHGRRSAPENTPLIGAFNAMSMDERWVNRSPQTMLETFHWFQGEAFDSIVEDLLAFPLDHGIIVEGFRLLLLLVKPMLTKPSKAVWLLPDPEFRRAAFENRGGLYTIARKTSDPDRALHNLLERDKLFTDRMKTEVEKSGLPMIIVDCSVSEHDLENRVAKQFGLGQDTMTSSPNPDP